MHGTGDDNVHYQGTERLVDVLVAANRPFTMMAYPNRTHCICQGRNTQLHLFELITRYLDQNLKSATRPAAQERAAAGSRAGRRRRGRRRAARGPWGSPS